MAINIQLLGTFHLFITSLALCAYPFHAYGEAAQKEAIRKETAEKNCDDEIAHVLFTPPEGWNFADISKQCPNIKMMVVGKGKTEFPPSLSLCIDPFNGTLKEYLKNMQAINASHGSEWKDLGTMSTEAGAASLSQTDMQTKWGEVRLMHALLVRNGVAYILTAGALKEEFSSFYSPFFKAMKSLRLSKDLFDLIQDSKIKTELKTAKMKLVQNWKQTLCKTKKENPQIDDWELRQTLFNSPEFQTNCWTPFVKLLDRDYKCTEENLKHYLLDQVHNELFD